MEYVVTMALFTEELLLHIQRSLFSLELHLQHMLLLTALYLHLYSSMPMPTLAQLQLTQLTPKARLQAVVLLSRLVTVLFVFAQRLMLVPTQSLLQMSNPLFRVK